MNINDHKDKFEKVVEHLRAELSSIRTGRATPALIENVKVEAYEGGEPLPIQQLASISVPEARQLVVEPWDKAVLKAIEKAITQTDLGLAIANDGSLLRLTMPLMTDEVRQQVVKVLNQKLEEARIGVRGTREKVKEEINKAEKDKDISEDEKYNLIESLDKLVKEYNDAIADLGDKKEDEISI